MEQVKTSYSEYKLTQEHADIFAQMAEEGDVFGRLSRSIAPEIFGMEDVKKVSESFSLGYVEAMLRNRELRGGSSGGCQTRSTELVVKQSHMCDRNGYVSQTLDLFLKPVFESFSPLSNPLTPPARPCSCSWSAALLATSRTA